MKNILAISSLTFMAIGLIMAIPKSNLLKSQNSTAKPGRILGGTCAAIKKYPYFVSVVVQAQERYDRRFLEEQIVCGGSIIGPFWVVTSHTCGILLDEYEIDLMDMYVRSDTGYWSDDKSMGNRHNVSMYYYNRVSKIPEGIGLIRVEESFLNADKIKIKLAGSKYVEKIGSPCTALGFGSTALHQNKSTNCLRQTVLKVEKVEICRKKLNTKDNPAKFNLMCASWDNAERGVCYDDTGGPLVQNGVLIGIISMITTCGEVPEALFVQVSKFQGVFYKYQSILREPLGMVFVDK